MDVYCHRLAKYIGSYTALMDGRLDAVIFTGGIGENAAMVRELSTGKLGVLGFEVDHERNGCPLRQVWLHQQRRHPSGYRYPN